MPKKKPGYFLREFEEDFERYWQEKKTGVKEKRKNIILDGESQSDSESDGNDSDSGATINTTNRRGRRQEFSIKAKNKYAITKE